MSSSPDVQQIYTDNPGALAAAYELTSDIGLQSIVARIDGSGAAGNFLPTVSLYSQDGKLMARVPSDLTYAPGDTGVVTWSPFLARRSAAAPVTGFFGQQARVFDCNAGTITTGVRTEVTFVQTEQTFSTTPLLTAQITAGKAKVQQETDGFLWLMFEVWWDADFAGDRWLELEVAGGSLLQDNATIRSSKAANGQHDTLTVACWPVINVLPTVITTYVRQDSGVNQSLTDAAGKTVLNGFALRGFQF